MHDLHNNVSVKVGVAPVAIGTTGTGQAGKIIDRQGYGGVEFILAYGTITATAAVYSVLVKEGSVTGTMTSVADADLLGTEAAAGVDAGTPRTSGSNKNCVRRIGYKGSKRYVQLGVKSTATAATPVAVVAVLHSPIIAPTANP